MKITKVEIKNFRNIKDLCFDLSDKTAVRGKNHIGKTNALQAIYWVLNDCLLDNVKEYDSIIPNDDRRKTVSVKLTFDNNHTFEKTYREIWQRTRGGGRLGDERMTGHDTGYIKDGALLKTKMEATQELKNLLFGDYKDKVDSLQINLGKAIIDPLYLFKYEDWRKVRNFIISLVGDISDDDVFEKFPDLNPIKQDLATLNGNTTLLNRKYTMESQSLGADLKQLETLIDNDSKKIEETTISDTDIELAKQDEEYYKDVVKSIKAGKKNPEKTKLQERVGELTTMIADISNQINEEEQIYRDEFNKRRDEAYANSDTAYKQLTSAKNELNDFDSSKRKIERDLENARNSLQYLNIKKTDLRDLYAKTKKGEFNFHAQKCPKCGAILNEREMELEKSSFESNKNAKLMKIVDDGKSNNAEISKTEHVIEELNVKLAFYTEESRKLLEQKVASLEENYKRVSSATVDEPVKKSSLRKDLDGYNNELSNIKTKIRELDYNDTLNTKDALAKAQEEWKPRLEKIDEVNRKLIINADAKKEFEKHTTDKTAKSMKQIEVDEKKDKLKKFVLEKLDMVKESTKKLFPDLDFILVEPNIKEGSFDEVCYPKIIGKETPFLEGSNSERILTGIRVIEDIKAFLNLEDLPIIFDEGETLDSDSISKILTNSQIITAVVDDNYITPTVLPIIG